SKAEELRVELSDILSGKKMRIEDVVDTRWGFLFAGANVAQIAGFFGAAAAASFFPVFLLVVPGIFSVGKIANMRARKVAYKMVEEQREFFHTLKRVDRHLHGIVERTLEDNLENVSRSPQCRALFETYPDLKETFADV